MSNFFEIIIAYNRKYIVNIFFSQRSNVFLTFISTFYTFKYQFTLFQSYFKHYYLNAMKYNLILNIEPTLNSSLFIYILNSDKKNYLSYRLYRYIYIYIYI